MESSAKQGKKAVGGGGEKPLSPGNMLLLALVVAVFIVTWVLEVP
jgi:hypothetical protein